MNHINLIKLTATGDTLDPVENFPSGLGASTHLGKHSCGGGLHLRSQSITHWIISCTGCSRNLEPPKSIDDYEKLRQWCTDRLSEAEEGFVQEPDVIGGYSDTYASAGP